MNIKQFSLVIILSFSFAMFGCGGGGSGFQGGGGGAGLNGDLTVTTTVEGAIVTATATYTNPTEANRIGVPISFAVGPSQTESVFLGTYNTNNSGSVSVAFKPPSFIGTKTLLVTVATGSLRNFSSFTMNGITMTMATPDAQTKTISGAVPGTPFTFQFNSPTFVTVTDPFNNSISNHLVNMVATFSIATPAAVDLLTFGATNAGPGATATAAATTGPSGTIPMPGTSLVLATPDPGFTRTATISWTATISETDPDPVFRGLAAQGTTVVTLTN
jgi:hypothetical protein